jgi:hypothetical protein
MAFCNCELVYWEIGLRAEPMAPCAISGSIGKKWLGTSAATFTFNSEIWAGEKCDTAQGLVSMADYFLWAGSQTTCTILGTKFSPRHGLGWHNIVYGCT